MNLHQRSLDLFPILPHPPELSSDKDVFFDELKDTESSFREVFTLIKDLQVETLVIVQSMGGIFPDGVTFTVPEDLNYDFVSLDDSLAQQLESVPFDRELAHFLQKSFHDVDKKTHVLTENVLPSPVSLLIRQMQAFEVEIPKIIVVAVSLEGALQHYEYGSLISRALKADSQVTMCLGIGNLSHCLSKESLAGYVSQSREYNDSIISLLESQSFPDIFHVDPFLIQEVGEDFFRPLCTGLGFLSAHDSDLSWKTLSSEESQGVGYLSGYLKRASEQ